MSYVISIIENDEFLQELVAEQLDEQGHHVISVETGTEGLRVLKDHDIDIILLDMDLPDYGADEYLSHVRKNTDHEDTIIIGFSSTGSPHDHACGEEHCLFAVINKPETTVDDIIGLVESAFSHAS